MPCLGLLHWFINFVSSPAPLSYLWAHLALVLPLAAAHVVVGEAHVAPHRAHLDRDHLTLVAGIQIFIRPPLAQTDIYFVTFDTCYPSFCSHRVTQ